MIEWELEYEISASGYDGYAAIAFDMKVIPSIVYEVCHEEWQQVKGFIANVTDWITRMP